jgi:hypothetical protein
LYQTPNPKRNSLAAVSASTTIVVARRAEAERGRVDLARPMAAINTGLQTGGGDFGLLHPHAPRGSELLMTLAA